MSKFLNTITLAAILVLTNNTAMATSNHHQICQYGHISDSNCTMKGTMKDLFPTCKSEQPLKLKNMQNQVVPKPEIQQKLDTKIQPQQPQTNKIRIVYEENAPKKERTQKEIQYQEAIEKQKGKK